MRKLGVPPQALLQIALFVQPDPIFFSLHLFGNKHTGKSSHASGGAATIVAGVVCLMRQYFSLPEFLS